MSFSTFAVTVQLQKIHLTSEPTLQLLFDFGTRVSPCGAAGTASRFREVASTAAIHERSAIHGALGNTNSSSSVSFMHM